MSSPVAIVLAGGANRRFWPLTQKSLLRFGDSTLLDRHVAALAAGGVHDVVVVGNPENANRLRDIAADTTTARLHVVVQPSPQGMGDAVLQCEPLWQGELRDRPLLVTQTHDLIEPALFGHLVARLTASSADAFVVGVRLERYFPGGYLRVDGDRALAVVEKPPPGEQPSDLVKIVADLVRRPGDLFAALRAVEPNPSDQYERALGRIMAGGRVEVVGYDGLWVPIKYPWDVLRAAELLLHQVPPGTTHGRDVVVHPNATITGPVVLGDGVKLFAGAAVVGPTIVGSGTILGNGALVRGSIVGRNCIVGYATEVARSYVGDGCEFHTNYVGDSVLGEDVAFGSGTTTANLRLDERNVRVTVEGQRIDTGSPKIGALVGSHVRVGINASIMPGIRIGSHCAIGPAVILQHDLADGQLARARQDVEVLPNPIKIDGSSRTQFRAAVRGEH